MYIYMLTHMTKSIKIQVIFLWYQTNSENIKINIPSLITLTKLVYSFLLVLLFSNQTAIYHIIISYCSNS